MSARRLAVMITLGAGALLLSGCNTIAGVGRDLESVGQGTTYAAEEVQASLDQSQ